MCKHPRRRVSAWEEEKRETRRSHVSVAEAFPTRMTAGMMDGHEMDAIGVSWAACAMAGRTQPLAEDGAFSTAMGSGRLGARVTAQGRLIWGAF